MMSPFDSPLTPNINRMMAETIVFNQQGQQGQYQGGGQGNPSTAPPCYNTNYSTYLQEVYTDSANNYRIYSIEKYGSNGGYQFLSWDGASAPTSAQKTALKRNLNGLVANADSRCVLPNNPGFVLLNSTLSQNSKGWESYRDIHEGSITGCTDSNAPNYNSNALTLDNSCEPYISDSNYYSKNSSTFKDGYRFEGKIVEKRKTEANGTIFTYETEIKKVCKTNSKCGSVSSTAPTLMTNSVKLTLNSSGTDWSNRTSLDNLQQQVKSGLDTEINSLESTYIPNCSASNPQTETVERIEKACDGKTFESKWIRYTSTCDGEIIKVICNFYEGGVLLDSIQWLKESGGSLNYWKNNYPKDSQGRAGYDGQNSYLKTLKDDYESALPPEPSTFTYTKTGEHYQGVIGEDKSQMLIWIKRDETLKDGCGRGTQKTDWFAYTYHYTVTPANTRPVYEGLNESTGIPIVKFDDVVIEPTESWGPLDVRPSYEELLGKVIQGCMDPNATNYDETANSNIKRSCIYPSDDDDDGDGETDYTAYMITGGILFALLLATGKPKKKPKS